ncbi:family 2 encapsulin nanocompartment cargo protein polyprenyl transferase [Dactylosporangium matsuzakiense]|uniref:Dimethylallyltransferase n=1 Tax=Dactylosporangium matsuzakiense TaxID=53360 RepID=A0A9W6KMV4_9ACTN|nr:family 2 encapsulin nanocompartment cargo protein polyprenyl transferase [Dactylosporangium matsuzakiense]GLL04951.1 dimethylallyltransferase [Dactylosporangium matsuzakiense]
MVAVIADPRTAQVQLAQARRLVDPALRAAVDTLPSSMRRIAGYHFGWWDPDGTPTRADAGKALRPALVFGGALAAGGTDLDAVSGAVAVELVHNFSLLHDDVMDGDATRRHRATAWSVFGTSAAILAGDALLALAMDVLAAGAHPASTRATGMLGAAVQRLLDGQSADLDFERRDDVGVDECLAMASAKTGALLGCACAIGALFGGGRPAQVLRLAQFGEDLGLAFQFADDLLGIWGDPAVTGKPVHSDLRSRKKSLPVVAALTSGTDAGSALGVSYAAPAPDDLSGEAGLIEAAGARLWAQAHADGLLARAVEALAAAEPDPRTEAELIALARLATRRDR